MLYRGHCFLHRAEMLGLHGRGQKRSPRRATRATVSPIRSTRPRLAARSLIEGDLLRLAGDLAGAEASYQRANERGRDPQPGLALLRLAQGRIDVADAMIRRVLDEAEDPLSRARLLGASVEIVLAARDVAARAPPSRSSHAGRGAGNAGYLRAQSPRAVLGAVLLREGEPRAALVELRTSFNGFHALGVPYEAARTRLLIAEACRGAR